MLPEIRPALEAAKAQRTNSSAGKRRLEGTFSRLQKLRKRDKDKEYPAIVALERLLQRVLSSEIRVLVEKEVVEELEGSGKGGLKRSSLRDCHLIWELREKQDGMVLVLLLARRCKLVDS